MSDEILSEISRYDADYRPDAGIRPKVDTLPDGDYDFEILDAILGRTQNSNDAILKVGLKVQGGTVVEKAYFFGDQAAINRLGADLMALGFREFERPQSFSAALKAALPKLKGVRFRARKMTDTSSSNGKTYHNLYIAGRLPAAGAASPPPAGRPVQQPAPAASNSEAIPF